MSYMNTKNKGFIAFSMLIWCIVIISTMISLHSAWTTALIYKDFYDRERITLANLSLECIERAHDLYISGIGEESFQYSSHVGTCWGKTGEILEATTTNSHFWYATSTKI